MPNRKIELDGCHVTYEEKCEYCGSDVLSVPETISQEELDELIKAKADGRLGRLGWEDSRNESL
jgi:coenzyme F420-reducing hydrogenase gamma subunit